MLGLSILFCFFFKQKTAYEMRISDWSSDVCSADLLAGKRMMLLIMIVQEPNRCAKIPAGHTCYNGVGIWDGCTAFLNRRHGVPLRASTISSWSDGIGAKADRKSVVKGKSVSVRVDPGGRRIIKKKKTKKK